MGKATKYGISRRRRGSNSGVKVSETFERGMGGGSSVLRTSVLMIAAAAGENSAKSVLAPPPPIGVEFDEWRAAALQRDTNGA